MYNNTLSAKIQKNTIQIYVFMKKFSTIIGYLKLVLLLIKKKKFLTACV